jgi:hypothetical protein
VAPKIKTQSLTEIEQSDGAQTFSLGVFDGRAYHQLQVAVSETPSAGTLTISIKSPGSAGFVDLSGTVDLTDSSTYLISFGPIFAESIKVTPTSFDVDKTFSLYLTSGEA